MTRAVCLTLVLCSAVAAAQSSEVTKYLNSAITLYENLEYEKALKQVERARKAANSAEDDTRVSLMEGVLFGEQGKDDKALTAFKTGFSLNPDAKLPVEPSPKVDAIARKARDNVRKTLAPQLEKQQAEAAAKKAEEDRKADEARRAEEERKRQEELARAPQNNPPPAPVVAKSTGMSLKPFGWAGIGLGVASAIGSTVCLLTAKGHYDSLVNLSAPPDQALGIRDSGQTFATLGYVLSGVAIAALVAGISLLVFGS